MAVVKTTLAVRKAVCCWITGREAAETHHAPGVEKVSNNSELVLESKWGKERVKWGQTGEGGRQTGWWEGWHLTQAICTRCYPLLCLLTWDISLIALAISKKIDREVRENMLPLPSLPISHTHTHTQHAHTHTQHAVQCILAQLHALAWKWIGLLLKFALSYIGLPPIWL